MSIRGLGKAFDRPSSWRRLKTCLRIHNRLKLRVEIPYLYRLRRLCWPDYCPPCYLRAKSGAVYYLTSDPVDDLILESMIIPEQNKYFPVLPIRIERALQDGAWILDLGAYNGYWSCEMLVRYPRVRSVVVECNPLKVHAIRNSLTRSGVNGRSRIIPKALANRNGEAQLIESELGSWGDWTVEWNPGDALDGTRVDTASLAELLGGINPILVKCNAEGAEYSLVRQLNSIERPPLFLIMMVHSDFGSPEELADNLQDIGYCLEIIEHCDNGLWLHARLTKREARTWD